MAFRASCFSIRVATGTDLAAHRRSRPGMRLSRAIVISLILASTAMAGCIENMGDLKAALGAAPPPAPPPAYAPPVAKAQANATSAQVGIPIRFLSEGTRDPQEFPLAFGWDLGDGARAEGPVAFHAYDAPGDYLVRLRVVSAQGLADEDTLAIAIVPRDGAPFAAMRILDANGLAAQRAQIGAPLTFDGAPSSDPERGELAFEWDFGDGATSHETSPAHAFAKPGRYDVALRVTDRAGQAAVATARVLVDAAWTREGAFEPAGASVLAFEFPVEEASAFEARLSFAPQAGLDALQVVVKDAAGVELGRSSGASAPGAQDQESRVVALDAAAIAKAARGAWTVEVVRESGLAPSFTLEVAQRA